MKYKDWIQDRLDGQLTPAELQAFDHELEENEQLREEWEAWTLTGRILEAAAVEPGFVKSGKVKYVSWRTLVISGLAIFMLSAGVFLVRVLENSTKEKTIHPPDMQDWVIYPFDREVAVIGVETPMDEMETLNKEINTKESTTPSSDTVENMKAPLRETKRKASVESIPAMPLMELAAALDIATHMSEEVIIADTAISEGSDIVITAQKEIILKPGFHVKPGTRFSATIVNQ
ncbi:MAG TPA: hypothetical protein PKC30_14620 [Saprospiraceae bacterium]|nr:hypothetical protein [Saprospiraceae bacterium]